MGNHRMFSNSIVDSDKFLDMPLTTQALYFHLGMKADDDGFVGNPKKVTRSVNCSEDDLRLLITKGFVIAFESGVIVITHWDIHNHIQPSKKKDTIYQNEKTLLKLNDTKTYVLCSGKSAANRRQIGGTSSEDGRRKIREDKIREDKRVHTSSVDDCPPAIDYQSVLDLFNQICVSLPKATKLTDTRRRKIKSVHKQLDGVSFNDFFERVETSDFLTGRVKKWRADFDWIMQPKNAVKIIEGSYDNVAASSQVADGTASMYAHYAPAYRGEEVTYDDE